MPWIVLVVSGAMEAVWATALERSDGFRRPLPVAVFVVGIVLSMAGLSYALKTLPLGTSYAVWVGIGAVLTVTWSFVTGAETVSPLKVVFLAGIVACVVGLRVTSSG